MLAEVMMHWYAIIRSCGWLLVMYKLATKSGAAESVSSVSGVTLPAPGGLLPKVSPVILGMAVLSC